MHGERGAAQPAASRALLGRRAWAPPAASRSGAAHWGGSRADRCEHIAKKSASKLPGLHAPRPLARAERRAAGAPRRRRVRRRRAAGAPAAARDPRAAPGGGRRAGAAGRLGAAVLARTARQPACRARGARRPGTRARRERGLLGGSAVVCRTRCRAEHAGALSSMKGGCRRLKVGGSAVCMDGSGTGNSAPHWSADMRLQLEGLLPVGNPCLEEVGAALRPARQQG